MPPSERTHSASTPTPHNMTSPGSSDSIPGAIPRGGAPIAVRAAAAPTDGSATGTGTAAVGTAGSEDEDRSARNVSAGAASIAARAAQAAR